MHSGITKDGFDIIFETNHLGHFLLTNSLLSLMEENGRIFNVSSDMHNPPENNFNWIGTEKMQNQIQIYLKIELDIHIQNYVIYILLMS